MYHPHRQRACHHRQGCQLQSQKLHLHSRSRQSRKLHIFSPPKRMPVDAPSQYEPPAKAPRSSYNKMPPKATGEKIKTTSNKMPGSTPQDSGHLQKGSTASEETPIPVIPCQRFSAQEEQPAPPADDPEERKRQKAETAEPPPKKNEPQTVVSSDDDDDWKRPVRSPSPKQDRTEPQSYAPPSTDQVTGSVMPGINALDR